MTVVGAFSNSFLFNQKSKHSIFYFPDIKDVMLMSTYNTTRHLVA